MTTYLSRQLQTLQAMSRLDLMVLLAVVTILASLTLPVLARNGSRSEMAACYNNLRIIGVAFASWSYDHSGHMPSRVPISEGGRYANSRVGASWWEFSSVSNFLTSPRVLACPSDDEARAAVDFSQSPNGGLLHFNYRNRSVSYFIGLDTQPELPQAYLSGDRNLRVDDPQQACSSGILNAALILGAQPASESLEWTNSIHRGMGNVLSTDGRVAQLSSEALRTDIARADYNGSVHLLMPR